MAFYRLVARFLFLSFCFQIHTAKTLAGEVLDLSCQGVYRGATPHSTESGAMVVGEPGVSYDRVRLAGDPQEHLLLNLDSIPTGTILAQKFAGCTSCGVVFLSKANKDGAKHCPTCGSPKDDETTVRLFTSNGHQILFEEQIYDDKDLAKKMLVRDEHKCAHCGGVHPRAFKICADCGFDSTHDTPITPDPVRYTPKKNSHLGAIIGGIVAAGALGIFANWAFTAKEHEAMVNDLKWNHNVQAKRFVKVVGQGYVEDLSESQTQLPNQAQGIEGIIGLRIIPSSRQRVVAGYHSKQVDDPSRPIYYQKKIKHIKDLGNDAGQVEEIWVDDTDRPPKGYEQKTIEDHDRPIMKTSCSYETYEWRADNSLSAQFSSSGSRASGVEPYWKPLDYSDTMVWYDKSASYVANVAYKNSKKSIESKEFPLKNGLNEFNGLKIGDTMKLEIYNIGGIKSYKKITAEATP